MYITYMQKKQKISKYQKLHKSLLHFAFFCFKMSVYSFYNWENLFLRKWNLVRKEIEWAPEVPSYAWKMSRCF
jgi:hypothetical protein